jgi:hypothetical protein
VVLALANNAIILIFLFQNQSKAAGACICVQNVKNIVFANSKESCCFRQAFLHS